MELRKAHSVVVTEPVWLELRLYGGEEGITEKRLEKSVEVRLW